MRKLSKKELFDQEYPSSADDSMKWHFSFMEPLCFIHDKPSFWQSEYKGYFNTKNTTIAEIEELLA